MGLKKPGELNIITIIQILFDCDLHYQNEQL